MNCYASPYTGGSYLIAYGINGYHNDVSSEVYDYHKSFEIQSDKLKMLVPLDMNNHRILNSPDVSNDCVRMTKIRITHITNGSTSTFSGNEVNINHSILFLEIFYKLNVEGGIGVNFHNKNQAILSPHLNNPEVNTYNSKIYVHNIPEIKSVELLKENENYVFDLIIFYKLI